MDRDVNEMIHNESEVRVACETLSLLFDSHRDLLQQFYLLGDDGNLTRDDRGGLDLQFLAESSPVLPEAVNLVR